MQTKFLPQILCISFLVMVFSFSSCKKKKKTEESIPEFTKESLLIGRYSGTYGHCGPQVCQIDSVSFRIYKNSLGELFLEMNNFLEHVAIESPNVMVSAPAKFSFFGDEYPLNADSTTFTTRLYGDFVNDSLHVVYSTAVVGSSVYKNELIGKRQP